MENGSYASKKCPICGKENLCNHSLTRSSETCWCSQENFPKEIFALVPLEQQGKSCICKKCLDDFKQDKCKAGG